MNNKPIVVVDWDNTVINTSKTLINLHNKLSKNKIKYIEEHDWKFRPMINSDEELKELFTLFDNKHFYDSDVVVPIKDAIETIKELSEHYKIIICSKHMRSRRKLTKKYIKQIFKGYDVSVKFVNSFNEKSNLFKHKRVLAVVDDKEECFKGFREETLRVLFGDYQWNREYDKEHSYKANNWKITKATIILYDWIYIVYKNKKGSTMWIWSNPKEFYKLFLKNGISKMKL